MNQMQKYAIGAFAKFVLPPILGGAAIGAGVGALSKTIHPESEDSMLKKILIGAGVGTIPGLTMIPVARLMLPQARKNISVGDGFATLASGAATISRLPLGLSAGYLGDQLITGGDHPGLGMLAGGALGMGSKILYHQRLGKDLDLLTKYDAPFGDIMTNAARHVVTFPGAGPN
jgi:hypothetical protein